MTPEYLAEMCSDAFWIEREQRASESSSLSEVLLAPPNPPVWLMEMVDNNVPDYHVTGSMFRENIPPDIAELYDRIYQQKLARIAQEVQLAAHTVVEYGEAALSSREAEDEEVERSSGEADVECDSEQVGQWRDPSLQREK